MDSSSISFGRVREYAPDLNYKNAARLCELTLLIVNILGYAGCLGASGSLILGCTNIGGSLLTLALHMKQEDREKNISFIHGARLVAAIALGVLGICGTVETTTLALSTIVAFSAIVLSAAFYSGLQAYKSSKNKLIPLSQFIPIALLVINALGAYGILSIDGGGMILGATNIAGCALYAVLEFRWMKQVMRKESVSDKTVTNDPKWNAKFEQRRKLILLNAVSGMAFGVMGFAGMAPTLVGGGALITQSCVHTLREMVKKPTNNTNN